jgi:hypothetical protein
MGLWIRAGLRTGSCQKHRAPGGMPRASVSVRPALIAPVLLAAVGGGAGISRPALARTAPPAIPPGAAALGFTKCVINERPTAADIAPGPSGDYKWFSGQWYAAPPSANHYSTRRGVLRLDLGGDLVSAPRNFTTGKLPLLPGADGFYVEFDCRLSDNDPDHFPAVWLMPAEHNGTRADQYAGDPAGYERWMELDVDEGGFGPGLTGTVHSFQGIYENGYRQIQNPNNVSPHSLDRPRKHTFGVSYDPVRQTVCWWLDGFRQMSAGAPYVPAIGARQRFYLIISAQSHGKSRPYGLYVSGVRAYVPPASDRPASELPASDRPATPGPGR